MCIYIYIYIYICIQFLYIYIFFFSFKSASETSSAKTYAAEASPASPAHAADTFLAWALQNLWGHVIFVSSAMGDTWS